MQRLEIISEVKLHLYHYISLLKQVRTRMEKYLENLSDRRTALSELKNLRLPDICDSGVRYIAEGIVIVCVAAYIFYENILMAFILSPYVYLHYKQRKKERAKKDNNEFCRKFRDGIMSVSFALNVGYSIENAFIQAVEELELIYGRDSDITIKFRYIVVRLGQNENIEDIFMDFAEESKVEDIIYFAEIFRYAKRSGGDLISIIRNTTQIIQQKEEVLSEIDTIISGKRMEQRVMSIIPAAIVVYLKFTAAEFIQPLYGNVYGAVIMTVCLIVYVIADMWAKRIVNIEV